MHYDDAVDVDEKHLIRCFFNCLSLFSEKYDKIKIKNR